MSKLIRVHTGQQKQLIQPIIRYMTQIFHDMLEYNIIYITTHSMKTE